MIYGYPFKIENKCGFLSRREISFQAQPSVLRGVARLLEDCADELENGGAAEHCSPDLASGLEVERVVIASD